VENSAALDPEGKSQSEKRGSNRAYSSEASPNAFRYKQSAPTPYRISIPLVGERIYDQHERFLTASVPTKNFGDFLMKEKARNAFHKNSSTSADIAKLIIVFNSTKYYLA